MALSALLGQSRATTLLGGSLASGRIHHAYLFAGPAGSGKTLAAKLVAQALNCESPAAAEAASLGAFTADPCGRCGSCKRIHDEFRHHTHPLVMWIDTEATMEANGLYSPDGDRTAAKAIGVRILRELVIPRLALTAVGGRRKVAILKDVDFTEGAQNAFLKTLEEPPPDTTFIVLSSTPDALKPTIRSRCLRVPFLPLSPDVVASRVAAARKLDPSTAKLYSALSGGNLGAALELDAKAAQKRRDVILAFDRIATDDWEGWLSLAQVLGEKDGVFDSIAVLETWLHDVAIMASGAVEPATNVDLAEQAMSAAQRLGAPEAIRRLELLQRAKFAIEGNAQPRLQLERAFLAFGGIEPLTAGEA